MKVAIFSNTQELSTAAIARIDNLIKLNAQILIGDANVDRPIQEYLYSKAYPQVTVYHSGKKSKVNVGYPEKGGYVSSGVRDIELCKLADYGLAIGTSAQIKKNITSIGSDRVRLVVIAPIQDLCPVLVAA
ncbi:hypothetical protein [Chamaesiphon sp.]|uniref:hypothetical protein n=1 Tax=Chamaesiphon sp. TaxID=2814140 RepID=UPI0035941FB5